MDALSLILQAADPSHVRYHEHVERLAARYWRPVYFYVRRVRAKNDADAKETTLAFLAHLLDRESLRRFDVQRGNFRAYVKQCLKDYLSTDPKRGARTKGLPFTIEPPAAVPAATATPDEEFERDWARELVDRCLHDAEAHLRRQKRDAAWEAFRRSVLLTGTPSHRDVADQLALTESDVRGHLRSVRRDLRQRVIKAISEYVVAEDDVLAEVAAVIGEE